MIYLDNNATTRVLESVANAMRPYLVAQFSNPASAISQFNGLAQSVVLAKAEFAKSLGLESADQIVITSGATEANNLALLGAARANPERRHIVASVIEHPSVLETVKFMESTGYRITLLPVSPDGRVQIDQLRAVLSSDTLMVSLMLANNETGVIQPVSEAATMIKDYDHGILVHTDATQALGKIPVDFRRQLEHVDLASLSAHKFHGPKGVGALIVRLTGCVAPLFHGGGQQAALRPGTENPAGLIGMMAALRATSNSADIWNRTRALRDRIQQQITAGFPDARVLGATSPRLPNTVNVCLPGVDGDDLVDRMAVKSIAISTGSACSHGAQKPSYVVTAMGLDHVEARSCVRISLSIETTADEIESFLREFLPELKNLLVGAAHT